LLNRQPMPSTEDYAPEEGELGIEEVTEATD